MMMSPILADQASEVAGVTDIWIMILEVHKSRVEKL